MPSFLTDGKQSCLVSRLGRHQLRQRRAFRPEVAIWSTLYTQPRTGPLTLTDISWRCFTGSRYFGRKDRRRAAQLIERWTPGIGRWRVPYPSIWFSEVTLLRCPFYRSTVHLPKCRWYDKNAHMLDPVKSEWADYAFQAYCCGNLSVKQTYMLLVRQRMSTVDSGL